MVERGREGVTRMISSLRLSVTHLYSTLADRDMPPNGFRVWNEMACVIDINEKSAFDRRGRIHDETSIFYTSYESRTSNLHP
jgi:hypothetical protein